MVLCSKHPLYRGFRALRRAGDLCPQCQAIREEFLKSGVKEKRVRQKKSTVVKLGDPVAAVPATQQEVVVKKQELLVDDELPGGLGEFDVNKDDLDDVL